MKTERCRACGEPFDPADGEHCAKGWPAVGKRAFTLNHVAPMPEIQEGTIKSIQGDLVTVDFGHRECCYSLRSGELHGPLFRLYETHLAAARGILEICNDATKAAQDRRNETLAKAGYVICKECEGTGVAFKRSKAVQCNFCGCAGIVRL